MRLPLEPPVASKPEATKEGGVTLRLVGESEESSKNGRTPSWRLKTLIDRLQAALELSERQVIHRYLAEKVGVSTRSVLRYDKGDVATAPAVLIEAAKNMLEQIRMGRPIIFRRGREQRPVVVRRQMVDLVDRIVRSGLYRDRFEIFRIVEQNLGLRNGRVARLYRSTDVQLIDRAIYDAIAELAAKAKYDPRCIYQIGDRIRHPVFGIGVVKEKIPKKKILVAFRDGGDRILREGLIEDPIRRKLCGSFDTSDHHVLAINRR